MFEGSKIMSVRRENYSLKKIAFSSLFLNEAFH